MSKVNTRSIKQMTVTPVTGHNQTLFYIHVLCSDQKIFEGVWVKSQGKMFWEELDTSAVTEPYEFEVDDDND